MTEKRLDDFYGPKKTSIKSFYYPFLTVDATKIANRYNFRVNLESINIPSKKPRYLVLWGMGGRLKYEKGLLMHSFFNFQPSLSVT